MEQKNIRAYTSNWWLTPEQLEQIKDLYLKGNSCIEIKELLNLPHTARSIQRNIKAMGIARSQKEAFKLAIAKGRMKYHKKSVVV